MLLACAALHAATAGSMPKLRLGDSVRPTQREAFYPLLFGPLMYRQTETLPFEFVKSNLDAMVARLPREVGEDYATALPSLGRGFCDASGHAQVEEFFGQRVKEYTGGPRKLAQALESIDLCSARTARIGPNIAQFLRSY
jgi:hypothetical protein